MPDPSPNRLDALMADLIPPGSIDRREVVRAVIAELGPIRALFVGLSLRIISRAIPALVRVGARVGIELLLRRLAPWLPSILLDSQLSAAEVEAARRQGDHVEDVRAMINVLAEVRRPEALHAVTRLIVEEEGGRP